MAGITVDQVTEIVEDFLSSYNGNIPVTAVVRHQQEEIYGQQSTPAAVGTIAGAYHPARRVIALVAANLRDANDARRAVRHELLGHYGLNTFTPEKKLELLDQIVDTRKEPTLSSIWERVDRLYPEKTELLKAEEVFAFVAEDERTFAQQAWDRVRSALQKALRSAGLSKRELTLTELRVEALVIANGIRNGERPQQTFPQSDQAQFQIVDGEEPRLVGQPAARLSPAQDALDLAPAPANEQPLDLGLTAGEATPDTSTSGKTTADGADAPSNEIESFLQEPPTELSAAREALLEALKAQFFFAEGKYHFRDTGNAVAFVDSGLTIKTGLEDAATAKAIVALATSKGWKLLQVKGSETFKRNAWLEGSVKGFNVYGYAPSPLDLVMLRERLQVALADKQAAPTHTLKADPKPSSGLPGQRTVGITSASAKSNGVLAQINKALLSLGITDPKALSITAQSLSAAVMSPRSYVGDLVRFGHARYNFDESASHSFFITVRTASGEKTVWGVDLPRALEQYPTQIGDKVIVAFQGAKPVQSKVPVFNAKNEITGERVETVNRNTWLVAPIRSLHEEAQLGITHPRGPGPISDSSPASPSRTSPPSQPRHITILENRLSSRFDMPAELMRSTVSALQEQIGRQGPGDLQAHTTPAAAFQRITVQALKPAPTLKP